MTKNPQEAINAMNPMMQMGNYIEQSKNLFTQMQEKMKDQTPNVFTGFPFTTPNKSDK